MGSVVTTAANSEPVMLGLIVIVKRKRTKAADASLSTAIGALAAGFLGS